MRWKDQSIGLLLHHVFIGPPFLYFFSRYCGQNQSIGSFEIFVEYTLSICFPSLHQGVYLIRSSFPEKLISFSFEIFVEYAFPLCFPSLHQGLHLIISSFFGNIISFSLEFNFLFPACKCIAHTSKFTARVRNPQCR